MKKYNFKVSVLFFLFLFISFQTSIFSETMILTNCKNLKNSYIKNEYILNFEKS